MQRNARNNTDSQSKTAQPLGFDCVLGAWHAHESEIRGFLIRRLADRSAAEDLLHEVFIRAMGEGRDFCRLDNPRAWLFRVARNAAVDQERRKRPAVPVDDHLSAPEADRAPIDALQQCLLNNLEHLSEQDRKIIRRCDLEGQRQADFARDHELGLPAAKSRLLRARARLRDLLIENCNVRFDESGSVCCHVQDAVESPMKAAGLNGYMTPEKRC